MSELVSLMVGMFFGFLVGQVFQIARRPGVARMKTEGDKGEEHD